MKVSEAEARSLLIASFEAAVQAVRAEALLPPHLPAPPKGRTIVVGAGKAAADMAACVERHWPADAALSGLVITRHGHGLSPLPPGEGPGMRERPDKSRRIEVIEAGHPLPDEAGLAAAGRILELVASTGPNDHILALISGGGSSLLTLPAAGLSLDDVRTVGAALLRSGAPIADLNTVRKHLSRALGGRMAALCRAPVTALLLSDVVGDDPAVIASGPFTPDPSTCADALDVLDRWRIEAPAKVRDYLRLGIEGRIADTPKPGDACFARIETHIVGNGRTALEGAAAFFLRHGIRPVIQGDQFTGEARELALTFASRVREFRTQGTGPVVLLSGGETQVTVRGQGRGGRNAEFLLALAIDLAGMEGVYALAADTDGIDGTEDNAGALITPDTLAHARTQGINPGARLADNDAWEFFNTLGDLLVTGPTRTNANDYRAILIT